MPRKPPRNVSRNVSEPEEPEEPNPSNSAHRTRACKLRAARRTGVTMMPSDVAWLTAYEEEQDRRRAGGGPADFGASQSERIVHVEERKAAVGLGEAAAAAAVSGAMVREEGRRIDTLLQTAVNALELAMKMYHQMAAQILERNQQLEEVHLSMLDSVREHFIARTTAEGEVIKAGNTNESEQKQVMDMIQMMMQMGAARNGAPKVAPKVD